MKFAVYCYDFPHWKTQTGLLALYLNRYKPEIVIGAPFKRLDVPKSKRIVLTEQYLEKTEKICNKFSFPYICAEHDEYKVNGLDFGIILGARILKPKTIYQYEYGIINVHPGILPDNRGLDNVKWAVRKNIPQGVTSHWINGYVDSGNIILRRHIPIQSDDTLIDIQSRVQNKEIVVLLETMDRIYHDFMFDFTAVPIASDRNTFGVIDKEITDEELSVYKRRFV